MVDEWEYQDNLRSTAVTVHWVAIQAGVHTLSDGRVVEAGTMLADDTSGSVTFRSSFVEAPVVVTSVMSSIDATAVDSSPIRVTRTGFDARLQEELSGGDLVQRGIGLGAGGAALGHDPGDRAVRLAP